MIHPEGAIQTPKGSGVYSDGKFFPLGKGLTKHPTWWEKCCQQVIGHKDGLRLPERLRAIACVNPPLNSPEEWGESVCSFLPKRNNLVFAVVTIKSGRNYVVSRHELRGFSHSMLRDRSGSFLT
jgi:hypothetical protein